MPKAAEHLARAKQNLQFAESFDLDKTQFLDWVVTAYFYAALHLVDAVLSFKDRIDPANHEQRREYVRTKAYLQAINHQYKELKDRSEDARYRLIPFTKAKVQKDVIPLYRAIEAHIVPILPK